MASWEQVLGKQEQDSELEKQLALINRLKSSGPGRAPLHPTPVKEAKPPPRGAPVHIYVEHSGSRIHNRQTHFVASTDIEL